MSSEVLDPCILPRAAAPSDVQSRDLATEMPRLPNQDNLERTIPSQHFLEVIAVVKETAIFLKMGGQIDFYYKLYFCYKLYLALAKSGGSAAPVPQPRAAQLLQT